MNPTETQTAPPTDSAAHQEKVFGVTVNAARTPAQVVADSIRVLLEEGKLHLPGDYSAENAIKAAWLKIQTVKNNDKKYALDVCTRESVVNALMSMVIQGLNVDKNQGYFIVYGSQLTWQRSVYGDIALAQRVRPGIEVYTEIVYGGDEFAYESIRGRRCVTAHIQKLENQRDDNIVAAYCGIAVTETGEDLGGTIMTLAEIKKSWSMSKTYNASSSSGTHNQFPGEMAIRTVTRRRLKPIINSSTDKMLLQSIRDSEDLGMEAEMAEQLSQKANQEVMSLEAPTVSMPIGYPPNMQTARVPQQPVAEPVRAQASEPTQTAAVQPTQPDLSIDTEDDGVGF